MRSHDGGGTGTLAPARARAGAPAPAERAEGVPGSGRRLRLTKWYLDVVGDDGSAAIVYAASLRWGALGVRMASVLMSREGAEPVERSVWSQVRLPVLDGESLHFEDRNLHVDGEWRGGASPLSATMLDDEDGQLRWRCVRPNAAATVRIGSESLTGRGYGECLTMTRLPWRLPLRALRWGRYTSPAHSVVWIAWSGGPPRQWIWLDGAPQPNAVLRGGGVTGLDDGVAVRPRHGRTLTDRRALQTLAARLPSLEGLLRGPVRDLRDTKWLERAALCRGDSTFDDGWMIREVVAW